MKTKEIITGLIIFTGIVFGFLIPGSGQGQNSPAERPGTAKLPSGQIDSRDARNCVNDYIKKDTGLKGGYFLIYDAEDKKALTLKLNKVYDQISFIKNENTYFACCDFKEACDACLTGKEHDMSKDRKFDIDFWLKNDGKNLEISRI
ncbi:MAG: hypothetical protein HZA48_03435, partial [Planctomycetes bacterium]|nr:hypothetical protein [Planctomycetota bacterium]